MIGSMADTALIYPNFQHFEERSVQCSFLVFSLGWNLTGVDTHFGCGLEPILFKNDVEIGWVMVVLNSSVVLSLIHTMILALDFDLD